MGTKAELMVKWQQMGVNDAILEAFEKVPRETFVARSLLDVAYEDRPLPTLRDQTISQPTTVMVMLAALDPREGDVILEVGAGVGYQAAILSHLVGKRGKVITTEIIPELVSFSRLKIQQLGRANVFVLEADGSEGVAEYGPYDKIVVTAAAPTLPPPLLDQLKEGGIIVAPIGDEREQTLVCATKRGDVLEEEFLGSFLFVPLRGKFGFKEHSSY